MCNYMAAQPQPQLYSRNFERVILRNIVEFNENINITIVAIRVGCAPFILVGKIQKSGGLAWFTTWEKLTKLHYNSFIASYKLVQIRKQFPFIHNIHFHADTHSFHCYYYLHYGCNSFLLFGFSYYALLLYIYFGHENMSSLLKICHMQFCKIFSNAFLFSILDLQQSGQFRIKV